MIDIITGIIATLVCGFGMGSLYFFTTMFWLFVMTKIMERCDYSLDVKVVDNVKDREEEKT